MEFPNPISRSQSIVSGITTHTLPKVPIEKAMPIKIAKREKKIPYTKKTPIFGVTGYHLERDMTSDNNYKYFSRLVEDTKLDNSKDENEKVSYFKQASRTPCSATISKPIKSVTINNVSTENTAENVGK